MTSLLRQKVAGILFFLAFFVGFTSAEIYTRDVPVVFASDVATVATSTSETHTTSTTTGITSTASARARSESTGGVAIAMTSTQTAPTGAIRVCHVVPNHESTVLLGSLSGSSTNSEIVSFGAYHTNEQLLLGGTSTPADCFLVTDVHAGVYQYVPYTLQGQMPVFGVLQGGTISTLSPCGTNTPLVVPDVATTTYVIFHPKTPSACEIFTSLLNCNPATSTPNTAPVITVLGSNPLSLLLGSTFVDPGASATDLEDGVVPVIATGTVNTTATGTYQVVYTAKDSKGLSATPKTRVVTVRPRTPPVLPPAREPMRIVASKIVCESESDLPNWANNAITVSSSTAKNFVATHPHCALMSDWKFQWGYAEVTDPGDSYIGEATTTGDVLKTWKTFGPTDILGVATVSITDTKNTSLIWVREVLKPGYVSYSGVQVTETVGAEMYCHTDVLYYDNYDSIFDPELGQTYYCLSLNARATSTQPRVNQAPVITLIGSSTVSVAEGSVYLDLGATAQDPEDGVIAVSATGTVLTSATGTYAITYNAKDSEGLSALPKTRFVTVTPRGTTTPTTNPQCSDGKDNDADGLIDFPRDPGCASAQDDSEANGPVNHPPVITVLGANPFSLVLGTAYTDMGATATDTEDGNITAKIVASGLVNVGVLGTYTISYNATDSQNLSAVTATRIVTVVAPTPSGGGGGTTPPQCADGSDNDGDGLADYPRDPGCISSLDNDERDTGNQAPVITLIGGNPISISVGSQYVEPRATVRDPEDGDISQMLIITGSVNTSVVGTYTIFYNATDTQGLSATGVTRSVLVYAVTSGGGGGTTPPQCADGSDNDGDGLADYPRDPGCISSLDNDERDTGGEVAGATTPGLTIWNESVTRTNTNTVVVTWNTNLPSTSRVVSALLPIASLGKAPFYGYVWTTNEDASLTTTHSTIVSVVPGLSYYFRPISRTVDQLAIGREVNMLTGTSAPGVCTYLEDYLRIGYANRTSEVLKLQRFLVEREGFSTLPISGVFDTATDRAVRVFQERYRTDVLTPWHLPSTTGYVYYTTRKKVNEIYCQRPFPLDAGQLQEILSYSVFMDQASVGKSMPVSTSPRSQSTESKTPFNQSSSVDRGASVNGVPTPPKEKPAGAVTVRVKQPEQSTREEEIRAENKRIALTSLLATFPSLNKNLEGRMNAQGESVPMQEEVHSTDGFSSSSMPLRSESEVLALTSEADQQLASTRARVGILAPLFTLADSLDTSVLVLYFILVLALIILFMFWYMNHRKVVRDTQITNFYWGQKV